VAERDRDSTPEMRANDLLRLIAHLDAGPAVVLGSSGGAVSALALAQAHPEQVDVVIAHEPPLLELLDDREERRAATEDMIATHLSGDVAGAWAKFLAQANITLTEEEISGMLAEPDPHVPRCPHRLRRGSGEVRHPAARGATGELSAPAAARRG
jgi:pimeloyl-ACP methyl ester carboxylesterase